LVVFWAYWFVDFRADLREVRLVSNIFAGQSGDHAMPGIGWWKIKMASGTHLLPRPKTYEDAAGSFAAAIVQPRVTNQYLRVALVLSLALSGGLLALNFRTQAQQRDRIVVRIDEVGPGTGVGCHRPRIQAAGAGDQILFDAVRA
jgi:hypothetical protein